MAKEKEVEKEVEVKKEKALKMRVSVKHDGEHFEKGSAVPEKHAKFFKDQGFVE